MPECAKMNRIVDIPRVLNMSKFRIWQSSEHGRVLNMPTLQWRSKYARTCLDRALNISRVPRIERL